MNNEGPPLEALLHRLSECPSEFVETCATDHGARQITAIVCDHFLRYGTNDPLNLSDSFFTALTSKSIATARDKRYWAMLGVATWLIDDDWFLQRSEYAELIWYWLRGESLKRLSEIVSPQQCIADPDRREELVRNCLASIGLRPAGESLEQASDRKTTLDSVERQRVLQATAAAERRAREVREAMAKKQALESASRYGE